MPKQNDENKTTKTTKTRRARRTRRKPAALQAFLCGQRKWALWAGRRLWWPPSGQRSWKAKRQYQNAEDFGGVL